MKWTGSKNCFRDCLKTMSCFVTHTGSLVDLQDPGDAALGQSSWTAPCSERQPLKWCNTPQGFVGLYPWTSFHSASCLISDDGFISAAGSGEM